jgi:hypothetical protein
VRLFGRAVNGATLALRGGSVASATGFNAECRRRGHDAKDKHASKH